MGGTPSTPPYLADFNGDHRPDVIVGLADGSLYAMGGAKGNNLWSLKTGTGRVSILAAGDVGGDGSPDVLIASGDTLFLIAGASGEKLWETKAPSAVNGSAIGALKDKATPAVLLASTDGIYALDGAAGKAIWSFTADGGANWVQTKAGIDEKLKSVVATSPKGIIYELTASGGLLQSYTLPGPFSGAFLTGDLDRSGRLSIISAYKDSLRRYRTDIPLSSGSVLRGGAPGILPETTLDYYAPAGAFAGRKPPEAKDRTEDQRPSSALAEEYYLEGKGHLEENRWSEAIRAFKRASEIDPGYKKEDIRGGIASAEDRLTETKSLYDQAMRSFNRRQWRRSIDLLKQATSITPGYPEAQEKIKGAEEEMGKAEEHYLAGRRLMESGRAQEAVSQLRAALDVDPGHEGARKLLRSINNLGTIAIIALTALLGGGAALYLAFWFRGGDRRIERRIDRLQEKLLENPSRSDVLEELSGLLLKAGRYDDRSTKIYEKALKAGYNSDKLTEVLSHIYLRGGRSDETALKIYEQAFAAAPGDQALLKAIGNIYLDQEREDEVALRIYEQLSEVVEDEYLYKMLSYIYGKREATDDRAMGIYAKALSYNPNDLGLISFLAGRHLIRDEPDRAAEMCRKALSLLPEEKAKGSTKLVESMVRSCYQTADIYAKEGRPQEAVDLLECASNLFPHRQEIVDRLLKLYEAQFDHGARDDWPNRLKLARIYREKGRVDVAMSKLVGLPPDDPAMKVGYASEMSKCLLLKGDARSAIYLLEEVLEGSRVSDETEELYYDLALAYQKAGLEDKYNITLGKIMVYDVNYKDVVRRIGESGRRSKGIEKGEP